nr:ABC transporter permease [Lachnospiraceae bacterium]
MKFRDMLRMSGGNLWKRKVRTILTVLGVVIGTASIVVMISLGLGLSRASLAEIEEYGGITTITVSEEGGMYSEFDESGSSSAVSESHLDDDVVESIRQLEHVKDVYAVLETDALVTCGGYQANVMVRGVDPEKMEALGIKLSQGDFPDKNAGQLQAVYGNMIIGELYNEKTGEGYWYDGQLPDIDLMTDTMMFIFDVESYYNFLWGGMDEEGTAAAMPKKRIIPTAGIMEGTVEDYGSNSYYIYCDIDELKKVLKKEYKNKAIPGQPTTAAGKAYKEIYYTSIMVSVDDMDYVKDVQTEINSMGYQASSNAEWVESMQGQYLYIELALGGIGAVSLIVAAIGIANTMMMSIYERTKEIGIMKVLGCDMRNIQGMFLLEAGYIGFIGGAVGLLLSYGLSAVINLVVKNLGTDIGMNMSLGISYIPLWLAAVSLVFAVFVGMAAGFFPSLRAMKLSPLAAIRNE